MPIYAHVGVARGGLEPGLPLPTQLGARRASRTLPLVPFQRQRDAWHSSKAGRRGLRPHRRGPPAAALDGAGGEAIHGVQRRQAKRLQEQRQKVVCRAQQQVVSLSSKGAAQQQQQQQAASKAEEQQQQ
nr:forkhead box protein P1-like [Penaeus vannamei]